uniref:Chaoptin n=2 Tax=Cacopsylla melanoneura TaxID=428564 RepID=A0A8D8SNM6_9HEMI
MLLLRMNLHPSLGLLLTLLCTLGQLVHSESSNLRPAPCHFNPLCLCTSTYLDYGYVTCNDVPLTQITPGLNDSNVYTIEFHNNGMRFIQARALERTGLYKLIVRGNPLVKIHDEAFFGLEKHLKELEIAQTDLYEVPSRSLRHLQHLKSLNLSHNHISDINADSWRGLESSLRTLILSYNFISSLPRGVFNPLTELTQLDLSGNNLLDIEPDLFLAGPSRINSLNLADNLFTNIPYHELAPLKFLHHLDLSYNSIFELRPSELRDVRTRLTLDTLRLDYNRIMFLPGGSFEFYSSVNKTYFNGNPLQNINADAFYNAKIRELYLVDCKLSSIDPAIFSGIEDTLQVLDLTGNNLTSIPAELFEQFHSLRSLVVKDNTLFSLFDREVNVYDNSHQQNLVDFDISGDTNYPVPLQEYRSMHNLMKLSVSRVPKQVITAEDFEGFNVDLEEIDFTHSHLRGIKNNAFRHIRSVKHMDLSNNFITSIDSNAFQEVGHSLISLSLSHAFSKEYGALSNAFFTPLSSLKYLDLSYNSLHSLSESTFSDNPELEVVELQDNHIGSIPRGLFTEFNHQRLQQVHFSFNEISHISSQCFSELPHLEKLYLNDNRIGRIDKHALVDLRALEELTLKGNKLRDISYEAFQNIPSLRLLDLSYNEMNNFDFAVLDQVGRLSNLKVNLSHNEILALHKNLSYSDSEGSNIKILDLSHNNISHIGEEYFHPVINTLTHLYLSHNSLSKATRNAFGSLHHLEWLDISANNIFDIDFDSFKNTHRLQVFYIHHNHLKDIPRDLFHGFQQLRIVDLSSNWIRALPDNLFSHGIERVSLSRNQLAVFPIQPFTQGASSTLMDLDLSHNYISNLQSPEQFSRFKNLMRLDLSYNRIMRLDDSNFATLPHLAFLDLGHNRELAFEPKGRSFIGLDSSLLFLGLRNMSLGQMPELPLSSLLSLSISGNRLSSIPAEIASNLSSLRSLDLSHNDLTSIPMIIHALPNLKTLSIASNDIGSLTNLSLVGGAEQLLELDITSLPLNLFESGTLSKMHSLRTLHISPYASMRVINLPRLLEHLRGLRNLHVHVDGRQSLGEELRGEYPSKMRNLTLSGKSLRTVANHVLQGVKFPSFQFTLHNTSVESLPMDQMLLSAPHIRNISIDVRNNSLTEIFNPNTAEEPGTSHRVFLNELFLAGNRWTCDCDIGWVEVWLRKVRQYRCRYFDPAAQHALPPVCSALNDDLRLAACHNKRDEPLLDVLKQELECGWGAAAHGPKVTLGLIVTSVVVLLLARF